MQVSLRSPELAEAQRIIGFSAIEKNEEIHREIEILLQILRDYTVSIENKKKAQAWRSRLSRDLRKEKLENDIRSFISELRTKNSNPLSLRPRTAREKNVVSFFVETERPRTAQDLFRSRTSNRPHSEGMESTAAREQCFDDQHRPRTADLVSRALADKDDVIAVCERLEHIAESIREELDMERVQLLDDVAFLHACFETEFERETLTDHPIGAIPTEQELMDLHGRLQVHPLITMRIVRTTDVGSASCADGARHDGS